MLISRPFFLPIRYIISGFRRIAGKPSKTNLTSAILESAPSVNAVEGGSGVSPYNLLNKNKTIQIFVVLYGSVAR